MTAQSRTPVVFFAHGSPTNALEDNVATRTWAKIAADVGRPKAILCISAHWYTRGTGVTAMETPRTIHDFGRGLPAPLFDLQYPAPGDPALAKRVAELLEPTPVALDQNWGLDHGTWSVLLKAYPDADIPVVQLSIDATKPGTWHHEIGERLKPLRDEGILIAGSGNVVHNLGVMDWNRASEPYNWATRFNDLVKDRVERDEPSDLMNFQNLGDDATRSIPSPDHYLPLLYVLGARHPEDEVTFAPDFVQHKSLSMTSIVLGGKSDI